MSRVVLLTAVALALAVAGTVPVPAAAETADDLVPGQILVKFRPGAPEHAKGQARRDAGAAQVKTIGQLGVHVWRVREHATARALAALQRNPHVEYAEQDARTVLADVTPNDPWWRYQWGPKNTNTPAAWTTTTGSTAVTIAVLDTGLTPSAEFSGKVLPGRNVLDGTADVTDYNGHGTLAASVAAATTNNAGGIAGYCWSCMLLPVKVLASSGTMSDVADGIVWATDKGADVISMSLGGHSGTTTVQNAVGYAASRGVVLVAAAGNDGSTSPMYPAAYPEVIGVAGSTSSNTLYSWSNYGPWIDVAAPGEHQAIGKDGTVWGYSGTSSATPAVAGIAGLALSTDHKPTATQVRQALNNGAVNIGAGVKHGRVDALNTLTLLNGGPAPADTTPPTAPGSLSATATSAQSVSLAWAASLDDVGVAGYRILRDGALVATTTARTHTDSGLTAGATYRYSVVAYDAAGNTSMAATASVTTPTPETVSLMAPTGVTATRGKGKNVAVAWNAVAGAVAGYRVYRNDVLIATAATTSFADSVPGNVAIATYVVTAFDASGRESSPSSPVSVRLK
ncbi:MAG TPA: S8 family serine peptidase [Egibacteraceae bacterium]|nr:S8 family serine peptidase [Egibacteraceae bacterium]